MADVEVVNVGAGALPPARGIPVTFMDSFRSWWSVGEKQSAASEERLLRKLPFFLGKDVPTPTPAPPVTARFSFVHLSKPAHYINTLSILPSAAQRTSTPPVVLLHGYGAGLGFFFLNYATLATWAERRHTPVYALDWLGMGRSARPPFRVKAQRSDIAGRVAEAEAFFVDSLEEWRAAQGVERMTLVGHSLGAYLSVVYALRHPERVARLVLLSPAGVPRSADNTTQPSRELDRVPWTGTGTSSTTTLEGAAPVQQLKEEQRVERRRESGLRRLAVHLWEEGWSPFQVVRSTLFWGPILVGKYTARRFASLTEEETRNMHDYVLNITLAKGSGEYCISHILAPRAHARLPLVDRVAPLKMPVTFIYGAHDWMDPEGGMRAVEHLRGAGNGACKVCVVPDAGHHVYLDNAGAVNGLLVEELEETVE